MEPTFNFEMRQACETGADWSGLLYKDMCQTALLSELEKAVTRADWSVVAALSKLLHDKETDSGDVRRIKEYLEDNPY